MFTLVQAGIRLFGGDDLHFYLIYAVHSGKQVYFAAHQAHLRRALNSCSPDPYRAAWKGHSDEIWALKKLPPVLFRSSCDLSIQEAFILTLCPAL